jgi:putative ABC transport system permease protein
LRQALERIAALPGVEAVGGANSMPPETLQRVARIVPAGAPESETRQTPWIITTPDYFRALGAEIVLGRGFTAADADGAAPVVVINRSLARTLYRDESPIGKPVRVLVPGVDPSPRTIVGVVNDIKYTGLDQDGEIAVFTPWAQTPWPGMYVSVRTAGEPMALARSVSEALAAVDSTQSVVAMASMETVTAASVATPRFYTLTLGLFGAVALLLAVIGIYGVIAYDVAQRTRELGIRLALGARPRSLVAMVVRQGAWLAGAGIVLGLAGAFAATRILAGMLYGVGATDVRVLGAAALFLGAVAVGASLVAARRAQSVDPMTALRAE